MSEAKLVQVHLYDPKNMLRPRGGIMQKESLSALIYEKLVRTEETWTDPKYGDCLSEYKVLKILRHNLDEEVQIAWNEFIKTIYKEGE